MTSSTSSYSSASQNAIERAGSLDPLAINAAVRSTNITLFFGPISFDSLGRISLSPVCQQYVNGTGTRENFFIAWIYLISLCLVGRIIAPANIKDANISYPSLVRAPKGFYDLPKKPSMNLKCVLRV